MQLRTNGLLQSFMNKKAIPAAARKVDLPPVNLLGIAPLLVILAVAALIAVSILLIERNFKPPAKSPKILICRRNKRRRLILKKKIRCFAFKQ